MCAPHAEEADEGSRRESIFDPDADGGIFPGTCSTHEADSAREFPHLSTPRFPSFGRFPQEIPADNITIVVIL